MNKIFNDYITHFNNESEELKQFILDTRVPSQFKSYELEAPIIKLQSLFKDALKNLSDEHPVVVKIKIAIGYLFRAREFLFLLDYTKAAEQIEKARKALNATIEMEN